MTNAQIILNERIELMKFGIIGIGNTGRKIVLEKENGEKEEIFEPEEIHTYQGWKELNRQVQRGEKAIASFQIWKHTVKKPKNEDEKEQEKMFLTKAYFFRECQTKEITD